VLKPAGVDADTLPTGGEGVLLVLFRRLAVATVMLTTAVVAAPSTSSAATSMTISWSLPSNKSHSVGFDYVFSNGSSAGGYDLFYEWPYSLYNNNPVMPNPVSVYSATTLSQVRMEAYQAPYGQQWNPLAGHGAVTVRIPAGGTRNVGALSFPAFGASNVGQFTGNVLSRTSVPNNRVRVEIFQLTGQPLSSTGYALDAFSATNNVGTQWQTGPLWNGDYIAFVTDTSTNRQAVGIVTLGGTTTWHLDLDMVCFGIDECQWSGTIPDATGEFHALEPTRIVDSRIGLGIPSIVKPGDGRNSDPNPVFRMSSRLNHEFKVAGVGGVPAVGVSAVLVNVTVTLGTSSGRLKFFPKPPRSSVFADQSSYPAANNQAAAVWWNAGEARATLQLLEVGVGGRIRIDNVSSGDVHVVVDVLGWVDQGQPGQDGSRLLTINPTRFLDTRFGTGGPTQPFDSTETRDLDVAGRDGIPSGAEAVVGTLTSVNGAGRSFQTLWPGDSEMPVASVLNSINGQVRPNLVSVAVGDDDGWALYNHYLAADLIFDAVGYFTAANGSGGDITAVPSATLYSGTMQAGADRSITVTGQGGVPGSGVSAVWVLITSQSGTQQSYLTAYPNGASRPNASNLNWVGGQSVANLALVPVGSGGSIRIFNAHGSASVNVSVVGWVN